MMEAFIVDGPDDYGTRYVRAPVPDPMEVVVQVKAVGICGSDMEMLDGTRDPEYRHYPVVLGHEWSGQIVELGDDVKDLEVGQYVAVEGHNFCGRCPQCKRGKTHLCETYNEFGFTINGGYAGYVAARADLCHPFSGVSSAEAALSEPTACALHGVLRSGVHAGDIVVVVGVGTIGLLMTGLLALYSPAKLIVTDRRSSQREASLRMGATHFLVEGASDAQTAIHEIAGKRGADIAFEAAGHPDAVRNAVDATGRGGKVILAGIAGMDQADSLVPDDMVFKDLCVEGVFAYPSHAFGKAVEIIDSGLLDVRSLITHRFPLSRTQEAFALLWNRKEPSTKVLLEPQNEAK